MTKPCQLGRASARVAPQDVPTPTQRPVLGSTLAPLAFVMGLAKHGAHAVFSIQPNGTREVTIVTPTPDQPHAKSQRAKSVPYAVFIVARDNGWLVDTDGQGLDWTLSQEGRLAIRRARSSGEGSINAASSSPSTSLPPISAPSMDAAESPLGWLRKRRDKAGRPMISSIQYDAGERLRGDLWFAQMSPRVTANWSLTGGASGGGSNRGVDIKDNVAAAQQRVRRAMSAVGPISAGLLIDVCGHLLGLEQIERARGWPPRSGKIALQMALCELARHYGLPGAVPTPPSQSHRVQHWGAPDYRPTDYRPTNYRPNSQGERHTTAAEDEPNLLCPNLTCPSIIS